MKTTIRRSPPRKNAMLRGKDFALHAELISWNRLTSEILASGSIILNAPDCRLLADTIWLNLSSGQIKGHGIVGFHKEKFFQANSMEKNMTSWTLTDARSILQNLSCLPPTSHLNIYMSMITQHSSNYLI